MQLEYTSDLSFDIRSPFSDDLNWLLEFLTPAFVRSKAQQEKCANQWNISFQTLQSSTEVPGGAAFESYMRSRSSAKKVDFFTQDSGCLQFAYCGQFESQGIDFAVYADLEQEQLCLLSAKYRQVCIIVKNRSRFARYLLMKVLREICFAQGRAQGALPMHAAAFALNRKGVLLCGAKRSGKTTQLLSSLIHKKADYIANDRCFISAAEAGLVLQGLPTIIRVRESTLTLFPTLLDAIINRGFDAAHSISECTGHPYIRTIIAQMGYRPLSNSQLAAFGISFAPRQTPLETIVFLNRSRGAQESFTRCTPEQARDLLIENAFVSSDRYPDIFLPSGYSSVSPEAVIEEILCTKSIGTYTYSEESHLEHALIQAQILAGAQTPS